MLVESATGQDVLGSVPAPFQLFFLENVPIKKKLGKRKEDKNNLAWAEVKFGYMEKNNLCCFNTAAGIVNAKIIGGSFMYLTF